MIAVDTNILVYGHREDSRFHGAAFQRLTKLAEGAASWAIPWALLARIHRCRDPSAHLRAAHPASSCGRSGGGLASIAEPRVDGRDRGSLASAALLPGGWSCRVGAPVHDARIAALCLQYGVRELWSADRDFSRFAGLMTVNPLVAAR